MLKLHWFKIELFHPPIFDKRVWKWQIKCVFHMKEGDESIKFGDKIESRFFKMNFDEVPTKTNVSEYLRELADYVDKQTIEEA